MKSTSAFNRLAFSLLAVIPISVASADEYLNGITWKEPAIVTPGEAGSPPSDAKVLFDGKDFSAWNGADKWTIEDGVAICGKGDIRTKEGFGDCQLHIEWSAPVPATGSGQGRGNSGVFLMDTYEVQVLDSFDNKTYFDGQASGVYKQTPPQVNATKPPGTWNVYDIIWTAPHFNEDGSLKSPAYVTVLHNGVLTLNHFELKGNTPFDKPPSYKKHADRLPIRLQDHGNPMRFRNIWIREIKAAEGEQTRPAFIRDGEGKERPIEAPKVTLAAPMAPAAPTEPAAPPAQIAAPATSPCYPVTIQPRWRHRRPMVLLH